MLRALGFLGTAMMLMTAATWRKYFFRLEILEESIEKDKSYVIVFWHSKYPAFLPLLRGRRACVFTSLSKRGDIIAELLRRLGFIPVQLPDHGKEESMQQMREAASENTSVGIAVDGPLGPFHFVHRGAVQLASELRYPILPISHAASPKYVLKKRWDKLELPALFAKVVLVVGEPFEVPPNLLTEDVEHWSKRIFDELELTDKKAADRLKMLGQGFFCKSRNINNID